VPPSPSKPCCKAKDDISSSPPNVSEGKEKEKEKEKEEEEATTGKLVIMMLALIML